METSSNSYVVVLVTLILSIVSATTPSMVGVTEEQLNCTSNPDICKDVCSESTPLSYSATFCDAITGSCVCDCRDTIRSDCEQVPFTTCFQQCVKKNPNPDVFLYEGGNCPITDAAGGTKYQCACGCSFRDDYVETNDVY